MREFKFEEAMRERVAFEKGKETKQLIAIGDVVLTEAQARSIYRRFPPPCCMLCAVRSMCCCMLCPTAVVHAVLSAPLGGAALRRCGTVVLV